MDAKQRRLVIAGAAAVVLLIVLIGVRSLIDPDAQRGQIEATLSDSLGRPVKLGKLDFSLFSGSLVATAPSIADDPAFSSQPFLTAKEVKISVELLPLLFHHQLHIEGFTINQPQITLLRAANGTWNYSSLGQQGKRKAPTEQTNDLIPGLTVGRMDIKDGTLTVGTLPSVRPARAYQELNVSAKDFSFAKVFPFTVSGKLPAGGSLEIKGSAGPINQRDASLTPLNAEVSLKHADLVAAGFVEPGQGIGGVADLESKLASNGQALQANGTLRLQQLKLAKNGAPSSLPVNVQFALRQDLQSLSGQIESARIEIGRAVFSLGGTYQTRGNVTTTQMHVDGRNAPVDEIVGFLPAVGVQLPPGSRLQGGTLTTSLEVSGPVATPTITGPVRVTDTHLAGFDLGQKLAGIQALTGAKTGSTTTVQTLSANLHYGPEGTRTDDLIAVVTGIGSASGSGFISPAGGLSFHLVVKLASGGAMGAATQAMGMLGGTLGTMLGGAARNGIPVTISGTTSSPVFTPDMTRMVTGGVQRQTQKANPLAGALGGLLSH